MRPRIVSLCLLAIALLLTASSAVAAQTVLVRVSVVLVDSNLAARPVPRHVLIATRADGSGTPVRLVTGFDGKTEVRLDAGAYIVESERPVEFQGRSDRWRQNVTVRPGASVALDLSIDNAIEGAAAPPPPPPQPAPASAPPAPPPAASGGGQSGGRFAPAAASPGQIIPKGSFTTGFGYLRLQGGGNVYGVNVDGNSWFGSKTTGVAAGLPFEFGFVRLPGVWISTQAFGLRIGLRSGNVRPFAQFLLGTWHFWSGCGSKCSAALIAPGGGVDVHSPGHSVGLRAQFDCQIVWPPGAGRVWAARMWGGLVIFLNKKPARD